MFISFLQMFFLTIFTSRCRKVHKNKTRGMAAHQECAKEVMTNSRLALTIQSSYDANQAPKVNASQTNARKFSSKENTGTIRTEGSVEAVNKEVVENVSVIISSTDDVNKKMSEERTQADLETAKKGPEADLTEVKKRRHKCIPTVTTYRLNK
jgi:hypothetical protein